MIERATIEAAIAALEAQRPTLGDAVIDMALAPLREKLSAGAGHDASADLPKLKQATVLFVDVVGSTEMVSKLDPEDIHDLMDDALRRFTSIVEGREGRVLNYTGDGLLAAFGADAAHEDDAESAVHAGLAIIAEARQLEGAFTDRPRTGGFKVRAGIDTGPVLLGGGLEGEHNIRGNAVNLAARMEQSAPAGSLRISHNTYGQVRGLFDVTEEPAIRVKGIEEPLRTYLVQRAKPRAFRVTTRGIEGLETRMVGRDAELSQLQSAFGALYEDPSLQSLTVVADAGTGKSRLLYEFENWAELQPQAFYIFKGRAQPQSRQQPYGLLRDVLAWRFQIADSDTADIARQKLFAGVAPLFADEGDAPVHLLGHLIVSIFRRAPTCKEFWAIRSRFVPVRSMPQPKRSGALHRIRAAVRRSWCSWTIFTGRTTARSTS